jgi:hypothetical protein
MQTQMLPVPPMLRSAPNQPGRRDVHNVAVDEATAGRPLCGMMHLPTGRTCTLPERHHGACYFADRAGPTTL